MTRPLAALSVHPLADRMPMLPSDAPEMVALRSSIELRGLEMEPLVITPDDLIVNGRHRAREARAVGLIDAPCIICGEEDVAAIIVESLIGRRHYTKGARAYLAFPLLDNTREAREKARINNLLAGKKSRASTESTLGGTVESLCEQLGFGRDLYFQARDVHKKFAFSDNRRAEWCAAHPAEAERMDDPDSMWFIEDWATHVPPDLRGEFEPKILSGERGLGDVIQAMAGVESTRGKPRPDTEKLDLLLKGLRTVQLRFGYWEELTLVQRVEITRAFSEVITSLPGEAFDEIAAALSNARPTPPAAASK